MAADKSKKVKIAEPGVEGEPEPIDGELVLNIEKLQEIQEELEKINEEASDKVFEVERKYNEVRRPVYVKRAEIIKNIPDFWLTAFLSHPALGDLLAEKDHEVFKFMQSIDVEDFKDVKTGYSITFNFSENPYFEDRKLTKTYAFADEGTTNVSGTKIRWKEGMDLLANGNVQEKKGSKRSFIEESFFSWFNENLHKNLSEGVIDEVAAIIKEDLWPNPLKYFNNEIDEDDFDGEDDEEETDGDDGEEDDGEQDDDDDEEEEDED
ncbi:NAP1-related protein 2-like [Zingiber officinale]|uniref:NAP1-related protein 2-like n=1 Tax=Zingiber officinale TaxID=94328 RepID=UPI001C4B1DFE|nr:NAP1-related protein 2-like [Zingiber officinale]